MTSIPAAPDVPIRTEGRPNFNSDAALLLTWMAEGFSPAVNLIRVEIQEYAEATAISAAITSPIPTYAEAAELELSDGMRLSVMATDTGTHDSVIGDVGEITGQTPNSGVFVYSASLTALVRVDSTVDVKTKTEADRAVAAVESVNFDLVGDRYIFGKLVAFARVSSEYGLGDAITTDGFHFAKYSIRPQRGLTFTRAADGFWDIAAPDPVVTSLSFDGGETISISEQRYAYGKKVVWAQTGSDGGVGLFTTEDGYVFGKFAIRASNGLAFTRATDGFYDLSAAGLTFSTLSFTSGDTVESSASRYYNGRLVKWSWAAPLGLDTPFAMAIADDGTVTIPKLDAPALNLAGTTSALDTTNYLIEEVTVSGLKQLRRILKSSGAVVQATTDGNNFAPRLSADGSKLVFLSDRSGVKESWWQNIDGSRSGGAITHPVLPRRTMLGLGDSIMATGWIDPVAANFGTTLVSPSSASAGLSTTAGGGIGSQKAWQIAYRYGAGGFGGLPALTCSLVSNTISEGANRLTAISNPLLSRASDTSSAVRTLRASILGVTGLLTATQKASDDGTVVPQVAGYSTDWYTYTFTPDAGQTLPGSIPAGSVLIIDPEARQDCNLVFHVGRNDVGGAGWQDIVKIAWAAIIAAYKPLVRHVLGIGVTNSRSEPSGSANHTAIVALNSDLAGLYPSNFYDVRPFYNAGEATDIPNATYTDDGLHPNTAGKLNGFTTPVKDRITTEGWFS